jgi:hypothetical protein
MLAIVLLGIIVGFLLVSCEPVTPVPAPTQTPYPTYTPAPTQTPYPTYTPAPTCQVVVTPTFTSTPTPTVTPTTIVGVSALPGGYSQYDWVCPYPLEDAILPDGRHMALCPNGLDNSKNPPVYKDDNAFRDDAGINWGKLNQAFPTRDTVELGGIIWVSWEQLEPREGEYHWDEIDRVITASQKQGQSMESGGSHVQKKGIIIRLYDMTSERPSTRPPIRGIDGGFVFRDHTPSWLKSRLRESVPWGGPLKDGVLISEDDGSYWVKMPCVYPDYVSSRPQGSDWSYSIWVLPKYNRNEWISAASRMLTAVAAHYDGSGVVFILGMGGLDGEWGNYFPDYYAGCGNLRAAFGNQYRISPNDMLFKGQAQAWRAGSLSGLVYSSCTAWCDPRWFYGLTGIYQARAVPDGPDYHRTGDIGVLDWALRFEDVGWENAFWSASPEYIYRMLSVISITWPEWFSFVGGSWDSDRSVLRLFVSAFGETITTAHKVWWRSYWSCYAWPDVIDCPDDPADEGDWSSYSGWQKDLSRGISTVSMFPFVNPWVMLTAEQRSGLWWRMLRRVVPGRYQFVIDDLWPVRAEMIVTVKYKDVGHGTVSLGGVTWQRGNTGSDVEQSAIVSFGRVLTLSVAGDDLFLHGIEVQR